jgi:hypothetical protein
MIIHLHETLGAGFQFKRSRRGEDCCYQVHSGSGDWGICEPYPLSPELSEWIDDETHLLYDEPSRYPRLNRAEYERGEGE